MTGMRANGLGCQLSKLGFVSPQWAKAHHWQAKRNGAARTEDYEARAMLAADAHELWRCIEDRDEFGRVAWLLLVCAAAGRY